MKYNIAIYVLFFILVIAQISFFNNFSFFLLHFNLVIVGLVLLLNLFHFEKFLPVALFSGVLMDLCSGLPFGTYSLTILFTFVILEILFLNFFTNHSLYSILLLGLIATVSYSLIFLFINGFLYLINLSNYLPGQPYFIDFLFQIVDNTIVLVIFFYIINSISKRFKPVFIKP